MMVWCLLLRYVLEEAHEQRRQTESPVVGGHRQRRHMPVPVVHMALYFTHDCSGIKVSSFCQ